MAHAKTSKFSACGGPNGYNKFGEVCFWKSKIHDIIKPIKTLGARGILISAFRYGLKNQYARGTISCQDKDCGKPRIIYSTGEFTDLDAKSFSFVKTQNTFLCGSDLNIPERFRSQIITTDQRFVCSTRIHYKYYQWALNNKESILCSVCAGELSDEQLEKFQDARKKFKYVQPVCDGVCSDGPNDGWITKGARKVALKAAPKRQHVMIKIDPKTSRPRHMETEGVDIWLESILPLWYQLRAERKAKSRIKKARRND